jgi:RNA polymerase sigma factor (sigma-70 family)
MKLTGNNWLKDLSDEAVIARFNESGNPAVLGVLYQRYARLVFGLCLKYLNNVCNAEDETMSIFEKLFADLQKYKIECFRAWLYKYSKNHCLMILRKKNPHMIEFVPEMTRIDINESEQDDSIPDEVMTQTLHQLLVKLKPEQQQCIRLFYLERLSYHDVSSSTGLSLNEVKSHIQNGKRNLRINFNKYTGYRDENSQT